MAEPRERPILFSGPMVRAILDGRKTQTRRVVAPQPPGWHGRVQEFYPCPYGQTGDRLWVRETWRAAKSLDALSPAKMAAACTEAGYSSPWAPIVYEADDRRVNFDHGDEPGKTRVSLHMPRWASRLTLEVTGVRVERLHDVSEADARAEGVEVHPAPFTHGWRNYEPSPEFESVAYHAPARESFASLWRSINGAESWDANPWVWVVEFRRLEVRHG